jgi:hypothetical protein
MAIIPVIQIEPNNYLTGLAENQRQIMTISLKDNRKRCCNLKEIFDAFSILIRTG